jgi:hypothetical protein
MLRRILEHKLLKVMGDWNNEDLHNLYSSPNVVRMIKPRMRRLRQVVHLRTIRNALNFAVVEKPEGRTRHRSEDSTKLDLEEGR